MIIRSRRKPDLLVDVDAYARALRTPHSAMDYGKWLAVPTVIRKDGVIDYTSSVLKKCVSVL